MADIKATGYVHRMLDEKQDFRQFTWSCARAMGALALMRDDPQDAKVPEAFDEHDGYHAKKLAKAKAEVAELLAMDEATKFSLAEQEKQRDIDYHTKAIATSEAYGQQIDAMLADVREWKASEQHAGLRDFMADQLKQSRSSCDAAYHREQSAVLKARNPQDVYLKRLEKAQRNVSYHTVEGAKEAARIGVRNAWLKQLRESVGAPDA